MPEPTRYYARLVGRTAIVTGAGSEEGGVGTGRAIAIVLAREGATVCLVDRDAARATETCKRIEAAGGSAFVVAGDVTSDTDCRSAVAASVERTGRLDILVNNVGVSTPVRLDDDGCDEQWSRIIDLNLKSALLMIRHAVPALKRTGGGSIINISSIAGILAHGSIGYGPSKAAMTALAREIAVMHGRDGIRANTVAPGHIMTPMAMRALPADARARRQAVAPLGVEGDAWDVAQAVLFLASAEARFITGALLPVDGGVTQIGPLPAHALIMADQ